MMAKDTHNILHPHTRAHPRVQTHNSLNRSQMYAHYTRRRYHTTQYGIMLAAADWHQLTPWPQY